MAKYFCRDTATEFSIFKMEHGRYFKVGKTDDEECARLISAAPELLEALQAVVAVADRKTDEFDRARAAIRKALGEDE